MEQGGLFDMEPLERPGKPARQGRAKWGGRASANARAWCRAMLPAACPGCGGIITAEDPESSWHAGHIEDRAQGGQDSPGNYRPEHARCNTSAGGKLGAAITNGAKVAVDWTRERTLKWW
jgi:hypothetical protein